MSHLASILLGPGDLVVGSPPVAEPRRSFFRLDDLAAALASELGDSVGVVDVSGPTARVPDGFLLVERPSEVDLLANISSESPAELGRRSMLLQVSRGDIRDVLAVQSVAAAVVRERFLAWVWNRHGPYPDSIFVRDDLVGDGGGLNPDLEGLRIPGYVAIDGTGRAPLVPILAAVIRSWHTHSTTSDTDSINPNDTDPQ